MRKPTKRAKFVWMVNRIQAEFPQSPEAQLSCAVVIQAIRDVFYPNNQGVEREDMQQALEYLIGEIPHAEVWGISSDWIRHLMEKVGFPDDTRTESRRHNHTGHAQGKTGRSRLLDEKMGDAGQNRPATTRLPKAVA